MTKILDNGDLLVTADNRCRAFIASEQALHRNFWSILDDVFEYERCNGGLTPFEPGSGEPHSGPFVGLTDSPCIAESMDYPDDGRQVPIGRVWWFPEYAVRCPLDELKRTGRAVFTFGFKVEDEVVA